MTDAELIRLPAKDAKYAAYRAAVEWGIANGLVHRPGTRMVDEGKFFKSLKNRQDLMAKAQAARLAKLRVE